jgi:hypothetical protein
MCQQIDLAQDPIYLKVGVHDRTSLEVVVIEMNHASRLVSEKEGMSTLYAPPERHSRTDSYDLALIGDLLVSTVSQLLHRLYLVDPAEIHFVRSFIVVHDTISLLFQGTHAILADLCHASTAFFLELGLKLGEDVIVIRLIV